MAKKSSLPILKTTEVPNVLEILKAELGNLKTITETQYKTDGNIEGITGFNIQTETEISSLIKAFSSVIGRNKFFIESAQELEVRTFPVFKLNNNTVESIKHDIQLRMAVLEHADRKAELESLIKEGEKFLTEKDQYNMYLQKIQKFSSK